MADDVYDSEDGKGWWWVWQADVPTYAGVLEVDHKDNWKPSQVGGASITDQHRGQDERADAALIVDARNGYDRATAAFRELLTLHDRYEHKGTWCSGCGGFDAVAWPCSSVLAVAAALGVEAEQ